MTLFQAFNTHTSKGAAFGVRGRVRIVLSRQTDRKNTKAYRVDEKDCYNCRRQTLPLSTVRERIGEALVRINTRVHTHTHTQNNNNNNKKILGSFRLRPSALYLGLSKQLRNMCRHKRTFLLRMFDFASILATPPPPSKRKKVSRGKSSHDHAAHWFAVVLSITLVLPAVAKHEKVDFSRLHLSPTSLHTLPASQGQACVLRRMSDTLKVTDIGYRLFSLNVAAPIPSEETFSLSSLSSLCFY